MEKASAACAMDWSIELEKGLRSKRPGQHLQSIQLTGQRIEKWSQEPKLKLTVYNMFRMVHGEERLFADTILLRLADAFSSKDRDTKIHIVRVFLSEMRNTVRKKSQGYGIFSKMSYDNQVEILRRIKVALDDEDIESKALTLVLVGCWSEIAKDYPEIRYEILSGLSSPHPLEVKASLFAAGCFAEFSYDFACVFLEILTSLMASPKTGSSVKVAAAWAFRKLGHFHSLTNKAYKAGSGILLKSLEDDWSVTMLISLSKLASKSMLLSSDQVSLLCGLLVRKIAPHMQFIVLRSFRHILEKASHITDGAFLLENLLKILDDNQASSPLRCEGLQLAATIVLHVPHDMLFLRMQELNELLTLVASVAKSPDNTYPERVLATQVLAGMSNKLKGANSVAASQLNLLLLPLLPDIVSSIGGEAVSQMKQFSGYCGTSDIELQFKNLLQLLFLLIDSLPEVSLLVLDNLCFIVETLVNICREKMNSTEMTSEVHKVFRVVENDRSFVASNIVHYAYKHLLGFVQRLHATEGTTYELLCKLKLLVSFVCRCNLFNCSTHVKFALLLQSCSDFGCLVSENGKEDEGRCLHGTSFCNPLLDGTLNRECIGNMLAGNDDWESYLVGKHAACQGAWFVCVSVFRHLSESVRSDIYSCWLSCLSQFAQSEQCFQEMFSQESQLDDFQQYILTSGSIELLTSAFDGLLSSERLLGQTTLLKQTFCFQRWFLALRTKVLEVIIDLLKLLATVLCNQEAMQIKGVIDTDCSHLTQEGDDIMHLLAGLSMKTQKIAREYDLMNSSFIGMDHKSFRVISSVAMSCSLLAFCIGLVYFTPNSPFPEKLCTLKDPGECIHVTVVEDLVGRLSHVDHETSINIISILKGDDAHEAYLRPHGKSHSLNTIYEAGDILRICRATVGGIKSMQNEAVGVHGECLLPLGVNKRRRFLLDITKELMCIPFRTPKFFFQVRPCIGAVLYSCSLDNNNENPTDISVPSGSHLSLNLCLQLKNMPTDLPSRITKVFCILHCKKSLTGPHRKPSETELVDYQSWTTESMLSLQEKLRGHVIERAGYKLTTSENDVHSSVGLGAEIYVRFEMNGGVQGFTTCLLDVSAFPVGLYKIDWLSCCIDESGSYWSLLPLSLGPLFTVRSSDS